MFSFSFVRCVRRELVLIDWFLVYARGPRKGNGFQAVNAGDKPWIITEPHLPWRLKNTKPKNSEREKKRK